MEEKKELEKYLVFRLLILHLRGRLNRSFFSFLFSGSQNLKITKREYAKKKKKGKILRNGEKRNEGSCSERAVKREG